MRLVQLGRATKGGIASSVLQALLRVWQTFIAIFVHWENIQVLLVLVIIVRPTHTLAPLDKLQLLLALVMWDMTAPLEGPVYSLAMRAILCLACLVWHVQLASTKVQQDRKHAQIARFRTAAPKELQHVLLVQVVILLKLEALVSANEVTLERTIITRCRLLHQLRAWVAAFANTRTSWEVENV